jgi:hypothetical protein
LSRCYDIITIINLKKNSISIPYSLNFVKTTFELNGTPMCGLCQGESLSLPLSLLIYHLC